MCAFCNRYGVIIFILKYYFYCWRCPLPVVSVYVMAQCPSVLSLSHQQPASGKWHCSRCWLISSRGTYWLLIDIYCRRLSAEWAGSCCDPWTSVDAHLSTILQVLVFLALWDVKIQSQDSLFSAVLHASCNAHTDRRAQQLVWWTTVAKADLNLTLQHQQHQPACRHLTSVCSQTPVGCKVVVHHTQLLQMNPRDALLCVHHAVHRCERSVW